MTKTFKEYATAEGVTPACLYADITDAALDYLDECVRACPEGDTDQWFAWANDKAEILAAQFAA
jgi:hypothetical protein